MIKNIEISNFKGVQNLSIDAKKINLLVGRNNTGKTTILEALNLFYKNESIVKAGDPQSYFNIYSNQKEIKISVEQENKESMTIRKADQLEAVTSFAEEFADFFLAEAHNLKSSKPEKQAFKKELLKSIDKNMTKDLKNLILKNSVLVIDRNGTERVYCDYSGFIPNEGLNEFLENICEYIKEKFSLESNREYYKLRHRLRYALFSMTGFDDEDMPDINFKDKKSEKIIYIKDLLDELEDYRSPRKRLTPEESKRLYEIVNFIKNSKLVENLADLKFDNVVFVGKDGEPKAHSFEFLGDGFKALIGLLWKLSSKEIDNSIILIDEPENHMHPGYIKELIKIISEFSENHNIQFFIVTHSHDLLNEILSEDNEKKEFLKKNLSLLKFGNLKDSTIIVENLDYESARETQEELLLDLRGT